ncbi:hypothetical protein MMC11_002247 [Xylographa trunciseda]|nr:hypothetical protein [Xylographa trunciseda]
MAAPGNSQSKPAQYSDTGTALDNFHVDWQVYIVDKIWAAYRLYPDQVKASERKTGKKIPEAVAKALNEAYGDKGPTVHWGPYGDVECLTKCDHNFTVTEIENIYNSHTTKDDDKWYIYRMNAMNTEWNGTRDANNEWSIKPQRAETTYLFATINEQSASKAHEVPVDMLYRQYNWSTERKRIFKVREAARRGPFSDNAVYKTHVNLDNWRYWGSDHPVDEGFYKALTAGESQSVATRLRDKGVCWGDDDGEELKPYSEPK